VWDFERLGKPTNEEVRYAKDFTDGIKAGIHKVDHSTAQSDEPAPSGGGLPGGRSEIDDEVPF
jgi:hypothetical protein